MYYQGTGKAAHGFRISVVMEDRFLLGFAVGNYRSVAKIEKAAMEAEDVQDNASFFCEIEL